MWWFHALGTSLKYRVFIGGVKWCFTGESASLFPINNCGNTNKQNNIHIWVVLCFSLMQKNVTHIYQLSISRPVKTIWMNNKQNYYSFEIFFHFWLVKTTCIIHNNQLLLTKFGNQDVKSAACCGLLNHWPRKPGDDVVLLLLSRKTKSEMAKLLQERENFLNE